jgi:hypothetical protein
MPVARFGLHIADSKPKPGDIRSPKDLSKPLKVCGCFSGAHTFDTFAYIKPA